MSEADGIRFTPWPHADVFPTWSVPALEAAKCVERQGPELFERVHLALYRAFFGESRNIADPLEVTGIVAAAGTDMARFAADQTSGAGRRALAADYEAALTEHGVRSIPTVILPATGRRLIGLAGLADYRAVVEEALSVPS
jgi:predicted DsbA family dithiol-disulfide isomerase